jgi:quinol-cytochrome oxidoreductase complex cytochrome b subunit
MRPFLGRITLIKELNKTALLYPVPSNLNYFWNFGSLAGLILVMQILTGVCLAFWYIPSINLAFDSVEFIMREVHWGWFFRYLHANGASFFFFIVYMHMGRNLFFSSYTYPTEKVWLTGIVIFLAMIITAFLGYVLPWGQMSYWAATVITSLISVIPYFGESLLYFVWGGIAIEQPTLTRVYGLHFLLPFIIVALVMLHLVFLHEHGSNNSLGIRAVDTVTFHPYFTYKDIFGLIVFLFAYMILTLWFPNLASHSDNYILANDALTPTHIVPEWYFLPFYGILRSVPSKLGGVLLLICAISVLFLLPILSLNQKIKSGLFRPLYRNCFEIFIVFWLTLGFCGGMPIAYPYYELSQVATIGYFLFFLVAIVVVNMLENFLFKISVIYSDKESAK